MARRALRRAGVRGGFAMVALACGWVGRLWADVYAYAYADGQGHG
jgi:hypothetical protein